MRSKLGLFIVLTLLAFAFPAVPLRIFETLCMIIGMVLAVAAWVEANLTSVLVIAALAAFAYYFPHKVRSGLGWLRASLAEAVRVTKPQPRTGS
ncbi:hypothetical protein [Streptomyces goshikiensis]|uniref:hypothetical protein n=1 Tax=Streptomyces goshikiensis TaxID=1942 RepID=UPI0036BC7B62